MVGYAQGARLGALWGKKPTVHVLMYLQAQHLDTEFYDTFFAPGAYLGTHADHQARWHRH